MSDTPALPVVTATVTPEPLPESFDTPAAAVLARDLAVGMYDEDLILKKAGLTPGQYETLKRNEWFGRLVEQMALDWNAPRNVQQRLAIQSAVGLETVLPDVIARAKVKNEPLAGVAQLVKVLMDMAGANSQNRQQAPAQEKFSITINLGADQEVYEKTKPVIQIDEADQLGQSAPFDDTLTSVRSGLSSLLAIQTEPEKA
jgi:hypothetical protein